MLKFKVTRGKTVQDVEAANEREALRRFQADNPINPLEPTAAPPTAKLVEDLGEPLKKRYLVKWGEVEREVVAVHEDDAWSQFVGNKTDADEWRHPNLHKRIITELGPAEEADKPAAKREADADETGVSPVADLSADDARDHIGRMRSPELLQDVIDYDQRVTVQNAATKRLEEIGGS